MKMSQVNNNIERILLSISFDTDLNTLLFGNNLIFICNQKLENVIKQLRFHLNASIPIIKLSGATFRDDPKLCRIIIVSDPSDIPEYFCFSKQSHIIIGIYNKNRDDVVWQNDSSQKADAVFYFNAIDELISAIVDIALDIVMSHYYRINATTVSEGKQLSKAKVEYKTQENNLNYISLASFHRNDSEYFISSYCQEWCDFYSFYMRNTNSNIANDFADVSLIFRNHPQIGQLSLGRLKSLTKNLSPGKYYLIRATKKPRRKVIQNEVLSQLGRKHWKTGYIKICTVEQFYNYKRYEKYLSIFPFTID